MKPIIINCLKLKNSNILKKGFGLNFENLNNHTIIIFTENDTIKYIENNIENIFNHCIFEYNSEKNICIIKKYKLENSLLKIVIKCIENTNPTSSILINIDLNDENNYNIINNLIENNFIDPYITKKDNLINLNMIYSKNSNNQFITKKHIIYVLQQFRNNSSNCYLYAKFSKKSINFLKQCCYNGFTKNLNGDTSQKEISGNLFIKNAYENDGNIIYEIEADEKSIYTGNEERIKVPNTRYNFHSHPREAYIKHSVKYAWPSVLDYLGYFNLSPDTIFHCVITLEGIYILSLSSYWSGKIKDIDNKFITRNYDIGYIEKYTPEEYVKKMNGILFQDYPIFNIIFMSWDECVNKTFKIFFPRIGSACIINQNILDNYKKY